MNEISLLFHCNVQHISNTFLPAFIFHFSAEWQDTKTGRRSQCQREKIAVAKNNTAEEPIGKGFPQLQQE